LKAPTQPRSLRAARMLPLVFIDESEPLLMPLLEASLLPVLPDLLVDGVLSVALGDVLLLSVVLGELIVGLVEALGDSLVLGDVVVELSGVVVVVLGDVVVELLGEVGVVVSDGIVVAFDEGCGCVACVVAVELELSVVDWA
jgi:hypothetical protein